MNTSHDLPMFWFLVWFTSLIPSPDGKKTSQINGHPKRTKKMKENPHRSRMCIQVCIAHYSHKSIQIYPYIYPYIYIIYPYVYIYIICIYGKSPVRAGLYMLILQFLLKWLPQETSQSSTPDLGVQVSHWYLEPVMSHLSHAQKRGIQKPQHIIHYIIIYIYV